MAIRSSEKVVNDIKVIREIGPCVFIHFSNVDRTFGEHSEMRRSQSR